MPRADLVAAAVLFYEGRRQKQVIGVVGAGDQRDFGQQNGARGPRLLPRDVQAIGQDKRGASTFRASPNRAVSVVDEPRVQFYDGLPPPLQRDAQLQALPPPVLELTGLPIALPQRQSTAGPRELHPANHNLVYY